MKEGVAMKTLRSIFCLIITSMIVVVSVSAQSGGTFVITKSVIAGGGGTSTGGTFIVDGTIGQPFGGVQSTGGVFSLTSGFWSPQAAPSPSPGSSIAGTITYAIVTKPVPGTTLTAAGTPGAMALTGADGTYTLENLGLGAYTVTPSKPAQQCLTQNGILANDAAFVAQFVVGARTFTPEQIEAAKAGGFGTISAFDAAVIARKVVGLCTNSAGVFKFMPVNKSYTEVVSNVSGEDYTAIMLGDVTGDWSPTGPNRPAALTTDDDAVRISLPAVTAGAGTVINVPVRIDQLGSKGLTSYQFDIEYDPAVIEPAKIAADLEGTLGDQLAIVANVPAPGLLKAAIYGAFPVTGDGVYANLKFNVVGTSGSSTPLTIRQFLYNDGTASVKAVNGTIKVNSPEPVIRGRLVTSTGEPVDGVTVVLTGTTGRTREVTSNASGVFEFSSLVYGETYTITVRSTTHMFAPQTISVAAGVTDVQMIAVR